MSRAVFPLAQPGVEAEAAERALCRDAAWDYEADRPVFRGGEPVACTGREAVLAWCWNALHTPRFRHEIYSWAYGCEVESLIGTAYSEALKRSEAARYVREALEPNPYLTGVSNASAAFDGDTGHLTVSCEIETVYGTEEVTWDV